MRVKQVLLRHSFLFCYIFFLLSNTITTNDKSRSFGRYHKISYVSICCCVVKRTRRQFILTFSEEIMKWRLLRNRPYFLTLLVAISLILQPVMTRNTAIFHRKFTLCCIWNNSSIIIINTSRGIQVYARYNKWLYLLNQ